MKPGILFACLLATSSFGVAKPTPDALAEAAFAENKAKVVELLKNGADATLQNTRGVSALGVACQNGNSDIVRLLLEAGANPESHSGGEPVLIIAARTGNPDSLKLLLDKGAKPNAKGRGSQTALMWAAAEGHNEAVTLLLKAGADKDIILKESGLDARRFAVESRVLCEE